MARSIPLFKQWGNIVGLAASHYGLARLYLAQEQRQLAMDAVWDLGQLASKPMPVSGDRLIPESVGSMQVHLDQIQGNLTAASRWTKTSNLTVEDKSDYNHLLDHLILARVCLTQEQPEAALRLLSRLLQQAENHGRIGDTIRILGLQTLALQASGDTVQALQNLQRALSLAEPEGYIRTFVDEGQPMRELLLQVRKLQVGKLESYNTSPISMEYLDRLVAAFGTTGGPSPQPANLPTFQPSNQDLAEPLSERELEVLGWMAQGLTNPEIAEKLMVTVGTVKSHANAIFGKLEVHNRTQAVTRARELGLLAS